ncbi:MAG: methyl-accepting chemotaxis protein [Lachnospiraceae bacterium]|nr:methyl-accepting chemotaxis protein [Lachnospiraceae bacterium]
MKNLKISQKLAVSFGSIILILIFLIVLCISSLKTIGDKAGQMYGGPFVEATEAKSLSKEIYEVQGCLYAAVIEKDLAKYENEINTSSEKANACITKINSLTSSPEAKTLANESGTAVALIGEAMAHMEAGEWDAAEAILLGEFRQVFEKCSDAADALYDQADQQASGANKSIGSWTKNSRLFMLGVLVLGIAIAVVVVLTLNKGLTNPIQELETVAQAISTGNINNTVAYQSRDELGILAESFRTTCKRLSAVIGDLSYLMDEMADGNFDIRTRAEDDYVGDFKPILLSIRKMNNNLSSTLKQIDDVSDQVASGSEQVSSGAQGLSQGATQQASAIEELAAAINEISEQVKQTSNNAKLASEQAGNAGSDLTISNQKMQDMISAMSEISEKSGEIGKIIKTIEDIAFQTNILALNAAVEAARAGTAGKGFAVVADEVRNLASKSAEAANNTTVLIESSLQAVENGTKIADSTAEALLSTVESTKNAVDLVGKISQAAAEQSNSIQEITQGVDQISSVIQTNSATAEESAAASEELSSQSQLLKELTGKFKLKNTEF